MGKKGHDEIYILNLILGKLFRKDQPFFVISRCMYIYDQILKIFFLYNKLLKSFD